MLRTRQGGPGRPCIAVLAVLGTLLVFAPAAGARAPRGFFGIQAWDLPSTKATERMGATGLGTLRSVVDWGLVESSPGARRWDDYDALMSRAAGANMRVLPVLMGSPEHVSARRLDPPRSSEARAGYAAFVRDAVARYGRGGTFWRARPEVPYRPVTHWQIWNEPNLPAYWAGRPSARQYVSLLKLGASAVRSRDRRAKVLLAGLPESRLGPSMTGFLRGIYRVRGAKRAFDVVAIHPYARDHRGVFGALTRVRGVMRRARDSRTGVFITESGWASGGRATGGSRSFRTSERDQARRLSRTVTLLVRMRRRYRLGLVSWFSWQDRAPRGGEPNWWAIHTGLLRRNGSAKPALRAYSRIARRR